MHNSISDISSILTTNSVAVLDIARLEIDETDDYAFSIILEPSQELDAWKLLHERVLQTRYYPVIVEDWGRDSDFFSRYWYENEQDFNFIADTHPQSIINEIPRTLISEYLSRRASSFAPQWIDDIDYELEQTQKQFGKSPERQEIENLIAHHVIQSHVGLEQWLFNWERHTFGDATALTTPAPEYLEWFTQKKTPSTLLLLPVTEGWNTLAYLHWYGALGCGTPTAIEMLRKWHDEYQATLVCHYGTMLQFIVGRPPTTPDAAFQLAWEQVALAECTTILPGVSIRDHARALLFNTRWFLHERP